MKGMPELIRVCGFDITIETKDDLTRTTRRYGEYDPMQDRIEIEHDLVDQQQEETLMHEILECIRLKFDLEISHEDLTTLSVVLHQVLRDNKLDFKD